MANVNLNQKEMFIIFKQVYCFDSIYTATCKTDNSTVSVRTSIGLKIKQLKGL